MGEITDGDDELQFVKVSATTAKTADRDNTFRRVDMIMTLDVWNLMKLRGSIKGTPTFTHIAAKTERHPQTTLRSQSANYGVGVFRSSAADSRLNSEKVVAKTSLYK